MKLFVYLLGISTGLAGIWLAHGLLGFLGVAIATIGAIAIINNERETNE